ncbi:MAG: UDP-N-acetylmuramate dehydrogenase [Patescibacteria group bacterium]|nr:UDP-N-acetylmuramate dehydrogenase [Patescibacteria group bacterium]
MRIRKNISLAPLSTFGIGGRVEYFCSVKKSDDLIEVIKWAGQRSIPYRVLAGGSNIVFPDAKLNGLLIHLRGGKLEVKGLRMFVDASVPLASVIKRSIESGLKGLETLSGIPGTVGGAVVGNAGAYGRSISQVVEKVEIWDPSGGTQGKGKRRWLMNKDCRFKYRESVFKGKPYLLLKTVLKFGKGNPQKLRKVSRDIIKLRLKKYKPDLRCPGSFFKNVLVRDVSKKTLLRIDKSKIIEGKIPTGYLLEEVGAKGMCVGGIEIADFHGNLFINKRRGTAADVKKLAQILKSRVKKKFGIELEEEIQYF